MEILFKDKPYACSISTDPGVIFDLIDAHPRREDYLKVQEGFPEPLHGVITHLTQNPNMYTNRNDILQRLMALSLIVPDFKLLDTKAFQTWLQRIPTESIEIFPYDIINPFHYSISTAPLLQQVLRENPVTVWVNGPEPEQPPNWLESDAVQIYLLEQLLKGTYGIKISVDKYSNSVHCNQFIYDILNQPDLVKIYTEPTDNPPHFPPQYPDYAKPLPTSFDQRPSDKYKDAVDAYNAAMKDLIQKQFDRLEKANKRINQAVKPFKKTQQKSKKENNDGQHLI